MEETKVERRWHSLREMREYYGLSLSDVGGKIGVTPPTVWQWEQHPNDWFRPRHKIQLLRAFSQDDIDELFDPNWVPKPKTEQPEQPEQLEQPAEQPAEEKVEEKPTILVMPQWDHQTPAGVISELMTVMSKLTLDEMQAVLNTAKMILATKTMSAIGKVAEADKK